MRSAPEFGVHRVHFHFGADFEGALPVPYRGLTLGFVIRRPAIHRQQRGDADARILERFLEASHAFGKYARRLEPFEKVASWRQFDPVVTEFLDLEGQLREREMPVHERIECYFHDIHSARCDRPTCGGWPSW